MALPRHQHPKLKRRVAELQHEQAALEADMSSRIQQLEHRLREQRSTSLDIAELTDLAIELLPAAGQAVAPQHPVDKG